MEYVFAGLQLKWNGGFCTFWLGMRKVSCLKKLLEDAMMGAYLNTVLKCMLVMLLRWAESFVLCVYMV